jgi:hypothetical protein
MLMLLCVVYPHEMKKLNAAMILSAINLPQTKADCSSKIISGRMAFRSYLLHYIAKIDRAALGLALQPVYVQIG